MFDHIRGIGRRGAFKAGLAGLIGAAALGSGAAKAAEGTNAKAAPEMNAAEKANLAIVTAYLRGYFDDKVDAEKMAASFADECIFQTSDTAPIQHGKAALIDSIKKGAENGVRWDIQVVSAFSRGPVVTVSRDETMHAPNRPERHIPVVVGLFIFKDGKIAEWRDFVPKS